MCRQDEPGDVTVPLGPRDEEVDAEGEIVGLAGRGYDRDPALTGSHLAAPRAMPATCLWDAAAPGDGTGIEVIPAGDVDVVGLEFGRGGLGE